jgi:hypothetical protein
LPEDAVEDGFTLELDGTPSQVRERLEERLMVVGDLWLPTRRELRDWSNSVAPLYLRVTRNGAFEVGPRLETIPAARFAPTLRGVLVGTDSGGTRLQTRVRWPRATAFMLYGFTLAVLVWGVAVGWQLYNGQTHLGWLGAVITVFVIVQGSAWLAWTWGRRQLMAEVEWLSQALSRPVVEGEDWG